MPPVPDPAAVSRLAARVREETSNLLRIAALIEDALRRFPADASDVVVIHGVGGLVHDFYTGAEKIFSLVSTQLDGGVPAGDGWHRELLHAMTLDLPSIRPPLLTRDTETELLELLKFRHVYRNMYGFSLRWSRIRELAEEVVTLRPVLDAELTRFLQFLDTLAGA